MPRLPEWPGTCSGLHGVLHGLPLTYNKDLQEDKEHLFDAADTLELCLAAADGMLGAIAFRRERLEEAASDEFLAATDIADLLVRRGHAVPRGPRQSWAASSGPPSRQGKTLSDLSREELAAAHSELLDEGFYDVLRGPGMARGQGVARGDEPRPCP